jgi:hypothetical protein
MTAVELFNEAVQFYTTNINNSFYVKIANQNPKIPEKLKKPEEGFVSKSMVYDQKAQTVTLDIFGGVRKAEVMLLTDEMGNEFYDEVIKTGKFDDIEKAKLSYNLEMLRLHGFNITEKQNKKGKNELFIELPYVFKINLRDRSDINDYDRYVFFKLKRTAKTKGQKETKGGLANFIIEPGDNTALSSFALYERFEPEGSKGQWEFGATTGSMPTTIFLRDRYLKNKNNFDEVDFEDEIAYLEEQLNGMPDWRLEEPVVDLESFYGVFVKFDGNTFSYFTLEKGKEVPYDARGTKTPQELLTLLDKENNLSAKERDEKKNPFLKAKPTAAAAPTPLEDDIDVSDQPDAEKAKKVLQDLMNRKKNLNKEIEERKKEDDAGCGQG